MNTHTIKTTLNWIITPTLAFLFLLAGPTAAFGQEAEVGGEIVELEEYNVFTSAHSTALETKRASDRIGSFLSASEIGNLPDDTLGEALSRLAGVNVVDGRVAIRGVQGRYNAVRIDGQKISNSMAILSNNTGQDTRAFDVESIPSELVESIEVIKSITADLDADSIGGLVNVKTANAFSFDERHVSYKLEYRYEEEGEDGGLGANITFADKINKEGTLGIYLNFTFKDDEKDQWKMEYKHTGISIDARQADPSSLPELDRFDPRDRQRTSERYTLSGSIDYKLSEKTTLHFKPWISIRDRTELRNRHRFRELDEREGNSRPSLVKYKNPNPNFEADGEAKDYRGNWWFLDAAGNPLGEWKNTDDDDVLGSAGDVFLPTTVDGKFPDHNRRARNAVITPFKESSDFRLNPRLKGTDNRENRQYRFTLGGVTAGEKSTLEYDLSWGEDTHKALVTRHEYLQRFPVNEDHYRYRYDNTDITFPTVVGWRVTEKEGHIPLDPAMPNIIGDFSLLDLNALRFQGHDFEETRWIGQIDYTYQWRPNLSLKFGGKLNNLERKSRMFLQDWRPDESIAPKISDFEITGGQGGFGGRFFDVTPQTSIQPILDLFNSTGGGDGGLWTRTRGGEFNKQDLTRNSDIEETILAGYAQATANWGDLTLIAGLRLEYTDTDYTWLASLVKKPDPGLPDLEDVTKNRDYSNWFPSFVATYRTGKDKNHVFRAAFSSTIARPDYEPLVPFDINFVRTIWGDFINDGGDSEPLIIGSPDLTEQTSDNFDLAWEWYFGAGNNLSVNFFVKRLEDFHFNTGFTKTSLVADDPLDPDTEFSLEDNINRFIANGAEQDINGVEVSWTQNLDFLPSPLDGFGFVFNYTYIDGEQIEPIWDPDKLQDDIIQQVGETVGQGLSFQPENIVNFQLYWEKWGFSARMAYNYVDEIKVEVFDITNPVIQDARSTVDLAFHYRINKRLRLFLEVRNITEERIFIFKEFKDFPEEFSQELRRWVFGIRGSL